jgi:hypothetical protein
MFIKTKILPPGFSAITLWPVVLIHPDEADNEIMRQHEEIHLRQWTELMLVSWAFQAVAYFALDIYSFWWLLAIGYLSRYLWYLIEWLVKLIIYRDWMWAYLSISFEREANNWERWPDYLKTRKHFYWLKYL